MKALARVAVALAHLLGVAALAQGTAQDGVKLFEQRRYAEAQTILGRVVASEPQNAQAHAYFGLVFLSYGHDVDQAINYLQAAVKLEDGNAKYHAWLGACYATKASTSGVLKAMSVAHKAKSEFERAVALDPKYVEGRLSLLQYYLDAPGIAGGSVAKAKEQAAEIAKLRPFEGFLASAAIAEHEKKPARAEEFYRQALTAEPNNGQGFNQLGYFCLRQNRTAEALVHFKRYVELAPEEADPYDSLGDGYAAAGSLDEAIASYERALAIDANFSASVYSLGQCYEKKAMWKQAADAYRRYLALMPSGRQSEAARGKLGELAKKQG